MEPTSVARTPWHQAVSRIQTIYHPFLTWLGLSSGMLLMCTALWANGPMLRYTLKGHKDVVNSIAITRDGKILASGTDDGLITLWDLANGKNIGTLAGHKGPVRCLAFQRGGKLLASGSSDCTIKLWNIFTQKLTATLKGHKPAVHSLSFSPDGKTLASGGQDSTIRLWDVGTGKNSTTLKGPEDVGWSVAFSPDGKLLASSGDGTIKLWDTATWEKIATLDGSLVIHIAFGPDGKKLAAGCYGHDSPIRAWDLSKTKLIAAFPLDSPRYLTSIAFSPDGRTLAVSEGGLFYVSLWDVKTGKAISRLKGHKDVVTSVAFSPDGKFLASGSGDKTVKIWDTSEIVKENKASDKRREKRPSKPDLGAPLTPEEDAECREDVYQGVGIGQVRVGGNPKRAVILTKSLENAYKKKPLATLQLLLDIVKGGRPADAVSAAAFAVALADNPFGATTIASPLPKSDDEVELTEVGRPRKELIARVKRLISKVKKGLRSRQRDCGS